MLKEALLGQDVEAQKQKRSRSWLSLLGSAVVYVWPSECFIRYQPSCIKADWKITSIEQK